MPDETKMVKSGRVSDVKFEEIIELQKTEMALLFSQALDMLRRGTPKPAKKEADVTEGGKWVPWTDNVEPGAVFEFWFKINPKLGTRMPPNLESMSDSKLKEDQ